MMDRRLKHILKTQNMMAKRKVFYISSATVALLATGIYSPQVIQADQTATTASTQVQTEQSEVQKVEENSKVETSQVDVESTTDSEQSENTTIATTSEANEATQTTDLTAQENTEKTLTTVESEIEPVQKEEPKQQLVEQKQGNDWYLIDKTTGEKATGFQRLEEQAKTVYYNAEGVDGNGSTMPHIISIHLMAQWRPAKKISMAIGISLMNKAKCNEDFRR